MLRTRLTSSIRPPWSSASPTIPLGHVRLDRKTTLPALETRQPSAVRTIHLATATRAFKVAEEESSFFKRIVGKIKFFDPSKHKRRLNGYLLYEDIGAKVDFMHFFTDLKMADTFYSWFVVTELHVWMLMTRYMAEGLNGQEMRNHIVEAMWADVNTRKSKLKNANVTAVRRQVNELSKQFNAAIIGYDEGIMSDDKVLAGALWRRFFQCEGNDPESLEKLVAYVRKQINELDNLPKEDVLKLRSIQWLDFRNP